MESLTHREQHAYSVRLFFDGNADFPVERLESYLEPGGNPKSGPITVNDWIFGC